jgi:hypothetical protein
MNKQPFYHFAELEGNYDEYKIKELLSKLDDVLVNTIELFTSDLVFTATDDVCEAAEDLLRSENVYLKYIESEAGNPYDLM